MKVSDLDISKVSEFLRLDDSQGEADMLTAILAAAVGYIKESTGLTDAEMDELPDLAVAAMVLCQDMYDNRAMYVDKGNANRVVNSILHMHRRNFV